MNVSEVARLAGIAPTAVRFYERRGVLPAAARRENGYRESLAAGEPDPNLCLKEGGDSDDELRMRAGVPVRTLLLNRG